MYLQPTPGGFALYKEATPVGRCAVQPALQGADIRGVYIDPAWRRKGYGSYLLKEVLRRFGGYDRETPTVFTAPLPASPGEGAFWAKFGFAENGGRLERRCVPDLSAVRFAHGFLTMHLASPRLCIDATCGNGGDTAFLCDLAAPEGKVLGFDIQQTALDATRAKLDAAGVPPQRYELICADHAELLRYVQPNTADAVMFNFGWLPGADHAVHSCAQSSVPALEAALEALRPGGVLSAVLYSGAVIGSEEKAAELRCLRALPLEKFTVLVCDFANWAESAPLPCFVIKK